MSDNEVYIEALADLQSSVEMMNDLVIRIEKACRFYEENNYVSIEHRIAFSEIEQIDSLSYATFLDHLNLYPNLKKQWKEVTMMQLKMTYTCGLHVHFAEKLSVLKKAFGTVQARTNLAVNKIESQKPTTYYYMGNVYNVNQAIAVGDNAQVNNSNFINQAEREQLRKELQLLIDKVGNEQASKEKDNSVMMLQKASEELENGNKQTFLEYLRKSGKWVFEVATKVGTSLLTEYIKHSQGL